MPPYVVQPAVQTYPPTAIRANQTSFPSHSFGKYTPYADAPNLQVQHPEAWPLSPIGSPPVTSYAGAQFAVRAFPGQNQNSPAITWTTVLTGVVTCDIRLQGALIDIDGDYFDIDKSTNAGGETRTVALGQVRVNFLRIKIVSGTASGVGSPPASTINAYFVL